MRCYYDSESTIEGCKSFCTRDKKCKGFTMLVKDSMGNSHSPRCKLATTSSPCLFKGRGPLQTENIGNLDPRGECGKKRYEGCFIKKFKGTKLI